MKGIPISALTPALGARRTGRVGGRPASCTEAQDVISSNAAAGAPAPHLHAPNTQLLVTEASHG